MNTDKLLQTYTGKTADFSAVTIDVELFRYFSAHVKLTNVTATSVTSFVEVSNDGETWIELPETQSVLSSAEPLGFYDLVTGASMVRVSFTIPDGSTDIEINYTIKE